MNEWELSAGEQLERREERQVEAADRIAAALTEVLQALGRRAVDTFESAATVTAALGDTPVVDPDAMFDEAAWEAAMAEASDAIVDATVAEGAALGVAWSRSAPNVLAVAGEYVAGLTDIEPILKSHLSATVTEAVVEGWSMERAAQRLAEGPFAGGMADTWARTAVNGAVNTAATRAFGQFAEAGDEKEWVATNDDRTRNDHWAAHGQRVPFDDYFDVGGERAYQPGDSQLSLAQRANCRCAVVFHKEVAPPKPAFAAETVTAAAGVEMAAGIPGEDHGDSAMIAFRPSDPAQWAVEGGLEEFDLHVTARYLGKVADLDRDQVVEFVDALTELAAELRPVGGGRWQIEHLGGPSVREAGYAAVVAAWQIQPDDALVTLRERVVRLADFHGLADASSWPDWVPHMTLTYELAEDAEAAWPEGQQWPVEGAVGGPSFNTISVDYGHEQWLIDIPSEPITASSGTLCEENTMTTAIDDRPWIRLLDPAEQLNGTVVAAVGDDVDAEAPLEWEAVLVVEGIETGDGRFIEMGALTWEQPPLSLYVQLSQAEGHSGAFFAGSIREIVRDGNVIVGRGRFDTGEHGQEARRMIEEGTLKGVSVDMDSIEADLRIDENADDEYEAMINAIFAIQKGRIRAATLCGIPAFAEAYIRLVDPDDGASSIGAQLFPSARLRGREDPLVATGGADDLEGLAGSVGLVYDGEPAAIAASAGPAYQTRAGAKALLSDEQRARLMHPDPAWFDAGAIDGPVPFTVDEDGLVFGHIALWGTCHVGRRDKCIEPPRSQTDYGVFHGQRPDVAGGPTVICSDGSKVNVGRIVLGTVHPKLSRNASDTAAWYADSGAAGAYLRATETEWGIAVAGVVHPEITDAQLWELRASKVSGDWRPVSGLREAELVALLAVNQAGFEQAAIAASLSDDAFVEEVTGGGRWKVLVASGGVQAMVGGSDLGDADRCKMSALEARVVALEDRNDKADRLAYYEGIASVFGVELDQDRLEAWAVFEAGAQIGGDGVEAEQDEVDGELRAARLARLAAILGVDDILGGDVEVVEDVEVDEVEGAVEDDRLSAAAAALGLAGGA